MESEPRPAIDGGDHAPRPSTDGQRNGPDAVPATVLAGTIETRYVRIGEGGAVAVLRMGGRDAFWGLLVSALAEENRVIVPELPVPVWDGEPTSNGARPAFTTWLRQFLDGLGLSRVSVVAGTACGLAALAFSLLEPERIERVALIHDDSHDPAAPSEALLDRLDGSGQPLLVVRLCRDPEQEEGRRCEVRLAAEIARFIRG